MRTYSWRRHNHPFTLSFLEEVLRWVGMNEVHKAITLFLETLDKQPGSPWTQRWEELSTWVTKSLIVLDSCRTLKPSMRIYHEFL